MTTDGQPIVAVTRAATGELLARAGVADTPRSRRRGLLGRSGLAPGTGLLIRPCSSIHTWFMKFPIDAVFIGRDGRVVRIAERVGPFRLVFGGLRAVETLELPAGTVAGTRLSVGDVLATGPADVRAGPGERPTP